MSSQLTLHQRHCHLKASGWSRFYLRKKINVAQLLTMDGCWLLFFFFFHDSGWNVLASVFIHASFRNGKVIQVCFPMLLNANCGTNEDFLRQTSYGKQLKWQWHHLTLSLLLVSPLHPNISMLSLHTLLYIFPKVLTRRICLTIKSFFSWRSFLLFSWALMFDSGVLL